MTVEATTVVNFNSSDTEYVFNIELDDVLNVDSSGEVVTSFGPEDEVYYRVNKSSNVTIKEVVVTDGTIQYYTADTRSEEENKLFTTRDADELETLTLSKIPSSVSVTFTGNREGTLDVSTSTIGEVVYTASNITEPPFLTNFEYEYPCFIYKYTAPILLLADDETHSVGIVFYIEVD